MKMFDLTGRVAIVTGGYGHLGKAVSLGLAEAGAKVFAAGRHPDKFKAAFGDKVGPVEFLPFDFSDNASVAGALEDVFDSQGRLDILVNNAYDGNRRNPVDAMTDEEWASAFEGGTAQVYRCIREALPYFRKSKRGSIINVSSMYGLVAPDFDVYDGFEPFLNPPHYGASKAGIIQLTKYFANYLAKENIKVNCVSPGPFPSPAVQDHPAFISRLESHTSVGRIGHPDDLKGVFVFLASDASNFVIGENITVDGGWTIR